MITVSLCMIAENEEKLLEESLNSIKDLVEEIIIVDTGLTDNTREIVKNYTSKMFNFKWADDFSAARNYSFSKATKDYVIWLDAGDILLENDRSKFLKLKKELDPSIDAVTMKYNIGKKNSYLFKERLLKRTKNYKWHEPVYEYLDVRGKMINSDITITNKRGKIKSDRNLKIFEKMMDDGKELSDRNKFYYAKELFLNKKYAEAIDNYNRFLETKGGYTHNYIDACQDLAKCYRIQKNNLSSLRSLYRSFEYDIPKAEICCQLGYLYKNEHDYKKAIFWYDLATKLIKPENSELLIIPDCWDVIPFIELSVCHYKIGNINKAVLYNKKAEEFRPNHPVIIHNKKYFEYIRK